MILKCTCSPAWPQLPITSTVLNNCFGVFRKLETEPELFKTLNRVYVFSSQCCPLLSLVTFWKVSLLTSRGQTVVNSHYKTQYIVLNTYNVKAFTSSNNIQVTALSCFAWMGHILWITHIYRLLSYLTPLPKTKSSTLRSLALCDI